MKTTASLNLINLNKNNNSKNKYQIHNMKLTSDFL